MYNCICAGKVEEFTAPKAGDYKLECWGAQGKTGGKGGYVKGDYPMTNEQSIYICVGSSSNCYNNKIGNITSFSWGREGGGATSITTTDRGELKYFVSYKDEVLLVAGGGGACEWNGQGGAGGGENGLSGSKSTYLAGNGTSTSYGTGGTQTSGGITTNGSYTPSVKYNGGFGYGGVGAQNGDYGAQGGGGWYGGGGSVYAGAAGGGSSHIGDVQDGKTIAGNTSMPSPDGGTETGHSGDGVCNITWFP